MKFKSIIAKNGTKYYYEKTSEGKWKRIKKTEWLNRNKNKNIKNSKVSIVRKFLPKKKDIYTIYGTNWCPWCKNAEILLERKGKKYVFHDIEDITYKYGINMIEELQSRTSQQKTIPIIFFKTDHVGGFTDLDTLLKQKSL